MIDAIIVLAFVTVSVTAGFRARAAASRSLEEYFLAGRKVRGWRAGVSMAATQYAADTPLLVSGLIATGGIFALWRLWIYALAFLMMGFLLGRAWRRAGVLTDAELVEVRYSGAAVPLLRGLKAVYFGTIINCTVLAMVLVAATRVCEIFLPWNEWLPGSLYQPALSVIRAVGVPLASGITEIDPFVATANNLISIALILVFVALYSTTGGLRSVVTTDIVQFAIAMTATGIYAVYALLRVRDSGGLVASLETAYGTDLTTRFLSLVPPAGEALLPFYAVIGFQWLFQMNSDGTGYLAQRTMACRSDDDGARAGFVFAWAQVFLRSLLWLPIAVSLLVLYPFPASPSGGTGNEAFTASREMLFVTGIRDLLPAGVSGLMLTAMLAALASTIDTHLNWGASYWSNDIYKGLINERLARRRPGRREMVLVARLSNIVILVLALAIMANLGSIQAAWKISLLFGAGIGGVLVLRWFWERINIYSELAAIASALVIAPLLLMTVTEDWMRLVLMAVLSMVVVLVVTLWSPPTSDEVLDAFYRRVRPAGLWRRTARRTGEDPAAPARRFLRGAWLVAVTAATLFLCLGGTCRITLTPPGRSPAWGWLAIAGGLSLVPLWWKALAGGDASIRKRG